MGPNFLTLIFLTLKFFNTTKNRKKSNFQKKNCVKNVIVKKCQNIVLNNFSVKRFKTYCVK